MSINGIRDAIKTAIATLNISAYDTVPDSINPPAAWVIPKTGEYDLTAGPNMIVLFEVTVLLLKGASVQNAQDTLDAYILPSGSNSFKAVLEAANLSTHADSLRVVNFHDYGGLEFSGVEYIGVKFDVEVII